MGRQILRASRPSCVGKRTFDGSTLPHAVVKTRGRPDVDCVERHRPYSPASRTTSRRCPFQGRWPHEPAPLASGPQCQL